MRIAIVDDIASERENLRRRLDTQLARLAMHAEISEFASGTAFLSVAGTERFDLAFMDIYMENENGVDSARKLRRFDTDCLLVFTTTSTDHALDGFRVRAMQYLVKPYSDEELAALFDEIAKRFPMPDKYIELNAVGGTVRLRFTEIQYAEHYRHQIYIHTTDGQEIVIRRTFREFTEGLSDDRFFLCNRDLSKSARLTFGDFLFQRGSRP